MSFSIIPITSFLKDIKTLSKKYPSLIRDIDKVVSILKKNPVTGQPLGKDCFKIRVAVNSKGRGKSGGARLITCVKIVKSTVYLLAIFDKADLDNISDLDLKGRLEEIKE